jgi:hypothetical protein
MIITTGRTEMNPFTQHPIEQGISYIEHADFALSIAGRLLVSVIAFFTHAIFPFISIEKSHDLEAMIDYLQQRNRWIEDARLKQATGTAGSEDTGFQLQAD